MRKYDHYYVNGYNFHTYTYGKNKSTMNYGVCVKSLNGVGYYGILQEVFELVYGGETRSYKTILFKCDWFDLENGTRVHPDYKLVEVNHTTKLRKYDPFILAFQAEQVYFTPYPSIKNDKDCWWAVFPVKVRSTIDLPIVQVVFQEDVNGDQPLLSNPNEYLDGHAMVVEDELIHNEEAYQDGANDGITSELETSEESNDEFENSVSNDEFENSVSEEYDTETDDYESED